MVNTINEIFYFKGVIERHAFHELYLLSSDIKFF